MMGDLKTIQKFLIVIFTIMLQACGGGGSAAEIPVIPTSIPNVFLASTTPGVYKEADTLSITLSFPSSVTVTGSPQVQVDIGGSTVNAVYASGSGSQNLIFNYVVQLNDVDIDGIEIISPIDLNSGSLKFMDGGVETILYGFNWLTANLLSFFNSFSLLNIRYLSLNYLKSSNIVLNSQKLISILR